jgi:stearoyl-CoA desaturase (Delta-9 desaturase)
MTAPARLAPDERVNWVTSIPFFLIHLLPFAAIWTGVSRGAVLLCAGLYFGRMFFITAGYHRYFAHRSYRMARVPQFLMALGGITAAQKGPLWWAAHHRDHHRYADTENDVHSPQRGFWWSHVGWILCDKFGGTKYENITDFARYPELRFLNKWNMLGPWALGIACYLLGGWQGLVVGFFWSTVNSLAHVIGRRRYATNDTSRNSLAIALITGGEGWHNNHHYHPGSARQGFFWWEFDPTFYVLRGLSLVGVVHDLRTPPRTVRARHRLRDGHFDIGMFRAYTARARSVAAGAGDRIDATREAVGDRIDATREAVGAHLQAAVHTAEEVAKAARRQVRSQP